MFGKYLKIFRNGGEIMANYEKTVLYIFPEIDKIVARVDEKFKEKVFS